MRKNYILIVCAAILLLGSSLSQATLTPAFGQQPSQEIPLTAEQTKVVLRDLAVMHQLLHARQTELSKLANPDVQARFQTWFGVDPLVKQPARALTIVNLLKKIEGDFHQGKIKFKFNPQIPFDPKGPNVVAYVYLNGKVGNIVLAPAYFKVLASEPRLSPNGWIESRAGTLIHEMSHCYGWEHPDRDYSWNGALNRAKKSPQGALKNAVNLRLWVEGAAAQLPAPAKAQKLPNPILVYGGKQPATGDAFIRHKLSVANWSAYPNELFQAAPDLLPIGLNNRAARTVVDIYDQNGKRIYGFAALGESKNLNGMWFAVNKYTGTPPSAVYLEFVDRRLNLKYKSNLVKVGKVSP